MPKDEELKAILMQAPHYSGLSTNHMPQLDKNPEILQQGLKK